MRQAIWFEKMLTDRRTDRQMDGSASENLIDYVISRAKKYVYKVNKLLILLQFFII